ncbi:hypothetical protein D1610_13635 [Sphingomonas gilva]|uniref:Antitoxin FitA-like ribbon-helix-helix domain-containing protein n=1 Tax=Sphingomonas gilva TaxID=2305907 RepID=A0A396RKH4_9SPHN|nr:hypothetical protein [Sphingomonas gilva]RHW16767.1 hypothetical protein D1610_13635 [Sphingomonas gilva]
MATLTIRKLDDAVYERLKAQAAANHRSLEAEARMLLEQIAPDKGDIIARLRESNTRYVAERGYAPDSLDLIRKMRDEE